MRRALYGLLTALALCAGLIAAVVTGATPAGAATGHDPVGHVDFAGTISGSLHTVVSGWAADPDLGTTAGLTIRAYVDGQYVSAAATGRSRPDVGKAHPSYGTSTGFQFDVPMSKGVHQLCVYAINRGAGSNAALLCTSYGQSYPAYLVGHIESITVNATSPQSVTFTGWALDPTDHSSRPVPIGIADPERLGDLGPIAAALATPSLPRADVAKAYPGRNPNSGFKVTYTQSANTPAFTSGKQTCLYIYAGYDKNGLYLYDPAPLCTVFP